MSNKNVALNTPTQFVYLNGLYFIVNCWGNNILYNTKPDTNLQNWNSIDGFNGAHRIVFDKKSKLYFIADTDNHRIITLSEKLDEQLLVSIETKLHRPHDIDIVEDYLYIIDTNNEQCRLIIYDLQKKQNVIEKDLGAFYARSINVTDQENLYVMASSISSVLKVSIDFDSLVVTTQFLLEPSTESHCSLSKYEQKVLPMKYIPNDLHFVNENYYMSNYFYEGCINKLIRFKSFDALKKGAFEDLSFLVKGVPYYFESVDEKLYLTEIDNYSSVKIINTDNLTVEIDINNYAAKLTLDFYHGEDLYSDGAIEDELLEIVKNEKDIEEVLADDDRWALLYHLSPIRQNILNWYPFKDDASVLEIGGGCGAITGVLCQKAHDVKVVELSKRRSMINYERNKHCDNLEIIVGNLNDISFSEKFDYITLIGVLEYAGSFTEGIHPYKDFLKKIRGLLKEDGKLLIAIENRYGLKYFAGAREDHTAKMFDGITGYVGNESVRTFGKQELEKLLHEAGYRALSFYYPHPDYKMPFEIYSDDFLPSVDTLLSSAPNYDNDRYKLYSEALAMQGIVENGQFPFFANSFFVECGV